MKKQTKLLKLLRKHGFQDCPKETKVLTYGETVAVVYKEDVEFYIDFDAMNVEIGSNLHDGIEKILWPADE